LGRDSWDELWAAADTVSQEQLDAIAAGLLPRTRSTSSTPRAQPDSPRARRSATVNILNNGFFVGEICRYTEEDRICIPVPFYHCFGMVMGNLAATSHGACMVIPAPGFDPAADARRGVTRSARACMACRRCSSPMGPHRGRFRPTTTWRQVRTGIMAGSPCPAELMKKVIDAAHQRDDDLLRHDRDLPGLDPDPHRRLLRAQGGDRRPGMPHLEIKIVDPATGEFVPRGQSGEFCTKGYSVMLGYWNQPTRPPRSVVDGWMHTGDLAVMDEDGYVQITGRIKDMVIRGGENIYPREIEEFLYTHPDILDAQVIGVPDQKYGEELMAWILVPADVEAHRAPVGDQGRRHLVHHGGDGFAAPGGVGAAAGGVGEQQ
jgi:fatty-acyl-CoA synthase